MTVHAECIYVFYQNLVLVAEYAMLIVDKHCSDVCCDEFPVQQTDCKSKQVKKHNNPKKFISHQYGEKLTILDT